MTCYTKATRCQWRPQSEETWDKPDKRTKQGQNCVSSDAQAIAGFDLLYIPNLSLFPSQ